MYPCHNSLFNTALHQRLDCFQPFLLYTIITILYPPSSGHKCMYTHMISFWRKKCWISIMTIFNFSGKCLRSYPCTFLAALCESVCPPALPPANSCQTLVLSTSQSSPMWLEKGIFLIKNLISTWQQCPFIELTYITWSGLQVGLYHCNHRVSNYRFFHSCLIY